MRTELGNYLKELRAKNGEKLYDMAKRLNITPQYLSAIENGKRTISSKLIQGISREYELSLDQQVELGMVANPEKLVIETKPLNDFNVDSLISATSEISKKLTQSVDLLALQEVCNNFIKQMRPVQDNIKKIAESYNNNIRNNIKSAACLNVTTEIEPSDVQFNLNEVERDETENTAILNKMDSLGKKVDEMKNMILSLEEEINELKQIYKKQNDV